MDFLAGTVDGLKNTLIPPIPGYGQLIPDIGARYGNADVYGFGTGVGTVAGVIGGLAIGNVASGASGLVACGNLAQKAALLYTKVETGLGVANAAVNIATEQAGVGDALALAPAIGFGIGKLSGRTNCFRQGTLVAAENGQKAIDQITAGERVWAFDLVTGQWRLCKVAETYAFDHVGDIVAVFVAGHKIESTYHHPYWVASWRHSHSDRS